MSTMMIVLIVITSIASLGLTWATMKDYEGWQIIFGVVLGMTAVFGWLLFGCVIPINTTVERIPQNKIEIMVGKDRIVVTHLELNQTAVLEDAKTYNLVTIDKDSVFNLEKDYNMYGVQINGIKIIKNGTGKSSKNEKESNH